jgi:hypothetical protein
VTTGRPRLFIDVVSDPNDIRRIHENEENGLEKVLTPNEEAVLVWTRSRETNGRIPVDNPHLVKAGQIL